MGWGGGGGGGGERRFIACEGQEESVKRQVKTKKQTNTATNCSFIAFVGHDKPNRPVKNKQTQNHQTFFFLNYKLQFYCVCGTRRSKVFKKKSIKEKS